MKKTLLTALVGLLLCTGAIADQWPLWSGVVATNGASVTTNTTASLLRGYEVRGIWLAFSGTANPTVNVDVVTSGNGYGEVAQTIFSKDDLAADAYIPIKVQCQTTAGSAISAEYAWIRLDTETITAWVDNANTTGITVKVTLDYENP